MHYWGVVIETLTHETESERLARMHRRRRREAARLQRSRSRSAPDAEQH